MIQNTMLDVFIVIGAANYCIDSEVTDGKVREE